MKEHPATRSSSENPIIAVVTGHNCNLQLSHPHTDLKKPVPLLNPHWSQYRSHHQAQNTFQRMSSYHWRAPCTPAGSLTPLYSCPKASGCVKREKRRITKEKRKGKEKGEKKSGKEKKILLILTSFFNCVLFKIRATHLLLKKKRKGKKKKKKLSCFYF